MATLIEFGQSSPYELKALKQLERTLPDGWYLTTSVPREITERQIDSVLACPKGVFAIELKASDGNNVVTPQVGKPWGGLARGKFEWNPFDQVDKEMYGLKNAFQRRYEILNEHPPYVKGLVVIMNDGCTLDLTELHLEFRNKVTTIENVQNAVENLYGNSKVLLDSEAFSAIVALCSVWETKEEFNKKFSEMCERYPGSRVRLRADSPSPASKKKTARALTTHNTVQDTTPKDDPQAIDKPHVQPRDWNPTFGAQSPGESAPEQTKAVPAGGDPTISYQTSEQSRRFKVTAEQKKSRMGNTKRTEGPEKAPAERWSHNGSTTRVFIGTTQGPVELLSLETPPDISLSLMRVNNTTTRACISDDYDAFVTADTGVIASQFGEGPYRANISTEIQDGKSWRLGMFAAHCLYSREKLAGEADNASAAIWVTGDILVTRELLVLPVECVPLKVQRSVGLFANILGRGVDLTIVVPEVDVSELQHIETQLAAVANEDKIPRIVMAKNCSQMCRDALDVQLKTKPKPRLSLWATGVLVVAGLIALFFISDFQFPSVPSAPPGSPSQGHLLQPVTPTAPNSGPNQVRPKRQPSPRKIDLSIQWDDFD